MPKYTLEICAFIALTFLLAAPACAPEVSVTALPNPASVGEVVVISAIVETGFGQPLADVEVVFENPDGIPGDWTDAEGNPTGENVATTNTFGKATVFFVATAAAQGRIVAVTRYGSGERLLTTLVPIRVDTALTLDRRDSSSASYTFEVRVVNLLDGTPVAGEAIAFETTLGAFSDPNPSDGRTDERGMASVRLTTEASGMAGIDVAILSQHRTLSAYLEVTPTPQELAEAVSIYRVAGPLVVAWSPADTHLALARRTVPSDPLARYVYVLETGSWGNTPWTPVILPVSNDLVISDLLFFPDGSHLVVALADPLGFSGKILFISMTDGTVTKMWDIEGRPNALLWAGEFLAVATETAGDPTLFIWDLNDTGVPLFTFVQEGAGRITALAADPGYLHAFGAADDTGTVKFWDAVNGNPTPRSIAPTFDHSPIVDFAWAPPYGAIYATAEVAPFIRILDVNLELVMNFLNGHTGNIKDIAYAPSGTMIASTAEDDTLRIWESETGILRFENPLAEPEQILWRPTGESVAVSTASGTIHLFTLPE
ncbi:MAG: hypothetical protein D6812_09850 [Deltaproteobacteria bacterium]|nr:MAG: hypothetical protein D6812_09850 [Deltaproteobacteria bacterium]